MCACVRVYACVCSLSCEEERAEKVLGEGGGKQGPGEDEREWARKEKHESTKEQEQGAVSSRQRRESAEGGERKEEAKVAVKTLTALHTLAQAH